MSMPWRLADLVVRRVRLRQRQSNAERGLGWED